MKLVDFLPVELQEVQLVTVELDFIFAHSFELALEPFARGEAKPIVRVAKLDGELGGEALFKLLLDLLHGLLDLGHGLTRLNRFGRNALLGDIARVRGALFARGFVRWRRLVG